jgi:hypothetical protein
VSFLLRKAPRSQENCGAKDAANGCFHRKPPQ